MDRHCGAIGYDARVAPPATLQWPIASRRRGKRFNDGRAAVVIRVYTLGTSLIQVGEHRFVPSSAKRFAFLLYVAAQPERHHPRSVLIGLLFPGISHKKAKQGLRELIYQLRQIGVVIETD